MGFVIDLLQSLHYRHTFIKFATNLFQICLFIKVMTNAMLVITLLIHWQHWHDSGTMKG